jgi:hypothetical protein
MRVLNYQGVAETQGRQHFSGNGLFTKQSAASPPGPAARWTWIFKLQLHSDCDGLKVLSWTEGVQGAVVRQPPTSTLFRATPGKLTPHCGTGRLAPGPRPDSLAGRPAHRPVCFGRLPITGRLQRAHELELLTVTSHGSSGNAALAT